MDEQPQSPQSQPQEEHPLAHLGNWKVAAGVGVVIVIILILSFGLTLLQAHMYPSPKKAVPDTTVSQAAAVQVSPTPSSQQVPELTQQHLSNDFSMKYPSGWTESQSDSLGSIVVTFTDDQSVASPAPQMTVASLDLTNATYSLSSGADLYRDYGYQEGTTTVDNIKAVKLTGIFPPPNLKNDFPGLIEWRTNIYLTKGENDYAIRYNYPGGKVDPAYEKLFSNMLKTLQLR